MGTVSGVTGVCGGLGVVQALRARAEHLRCASKTLPEPATYGVELEFLASRAPGLWNAYRPESADADVWERLTESDRILHVIDWRDEMIGTRRAHEARLVQIASQNIRVGSEFPPEMTIEPNGVFEMRKHPFASCADVASFLADVVEFMGVPQAQVHLVFPLAELGDFSLVSLAQSDRAHFAKLGLDFAKGTPPAASFPSAFLPPMDSASHRTLARQSRWVSEKQALGHTIKSLCAPVLRPGSLYGLPRCAGIEVRQWDIPTGPECAQPELLLGLLDDVSELRQWLVTRRLPDTLAAWAATPPTSELGAWERVRSFVSFPYSDTWIRVLDAIEFALVRRNGNALKVNPRCPFLFPLRAFDVSFPALAARILAAQETYVSQLVGWERSLEDMPASVFETRSSLEALLAPLRAAVADFANASGLARLAFQEVFVQGE